MSDGQTDKRTQRDRHRPMASTADTIEIGKNRPVSTKTREVLFENCEKTFNFGLKLANFVPFTVCIICR